MLIRTLSFLLTASAIVASPQAIVAPAVGGFLAGDNGDRAFGRALSGSGFGVGKPNSISTVGSREYQAAYEWDLYARKYLRIKSHR
jgi:hypothetical protein